MERGEHEENREGQEMAHRRKRKKSSAYILYVLVAFLLATYVGYTTKNVFFTLLIIILGVGIAVASR